MKVELTFDGKDGISKKLVDLDELPEYITELQSIFGNIRILPINTFNGVLRKGKSSNGLTQLVSWKPFQISEEEYKRIKSSYLPR